MAHKDSTQSAMFHRDIAKLIGPVFSLKHHSEIGFCVQWGSGDVEICLDHVAEIDDIGLLINRNVISYPAQALAKRSHISTEKLAGHLLLLGWRLFVSSRDELSDCMEVQFERV